MPPTITLDRREAGRHRAGRPTSTSSIRTPSAAAVITLLLVTAVVLGSWSWLREDEAVVSLGGRYPGTAPAEWSPGATWSSAALLNDTRPIALGSDRIGLMTAERQVAVIATADGQVQWRDALPDGVVRTPLTPTRIGGKEVLALHVGERLVWWSSDGSRDETELPQGSALSTLGEIPLVALPDGRVYAVTNSEVTDASAIHLPAGSYALAAHEDGHITAAGPAGWWHVGPEGSTRSSGAWENPSSAAPTVAGYTGGFVVLVRPGDPARVEVHADRAADVRYVFSSPIVLSGAQVTWKPSPSGRWGVLGRTLVDLRKGRVEDLGAWSTRTVTDDRAFGHIAGQTVVVGPGIPRGVLSPREAIPDIVTREGAVVRGPALDTDDRGTDPRRQNDVAYLLPIRRTAS